MPYPSFQPGDKVLSSSQVYVVLDEFLHLGSNLKFLLLIFYLFPNTASEDQFDIETFC